MKEIYKSQSFEQVRYDVRGPALDEAERLRSLGVPIVQLNTGNPGAFGMEPPKAVLDAVRENVGKATPYSMTKGLPEAREAIAGYLRSKGVMTDPESVFTGNGVSELIHMAMKTLLNDGDEILIPMPDYPLWTAAVTMYGGKAVHYICDEQSHWNPDIADIRKKITPRTKALVVINPNNPTGVLYPREICEQLADIAREHDLIIFTDEIYEAVIMDDKEHTPMAALAPERFVVTFGGLSKSHNLAGFRVGWMALSGDLHSARDYITGLNTMAATRLCSNVLAQYAIAPALADFSGTRRDFSPGGRIYEQRKYIVNALADIPGLSAVKPDAAFYIFPKLDAKRFNIKDDEKFVLDFLREKHILLVSGSGFNWHAPDHVRIVYLPELEELTYVAESFRDFLAHYRQK